MILMSDSQTTPTTLQIARSLDHALLHPTMRDQEIQEGCQVAARLNCVTVCVKPYAIPLAVAVLQGTQTSVGTVVGFPSGSHPSQVKAEEAEWACRAGASELDMVVNVGKVLQNDWGYVQDDIAAVLTVARENKALLKVIFETDYITKEADKIRLCEICSELGVDFVKTSTGFGFTKGANGYGYQGATEDDIRLMRATCSSDVQVKASGGIRNREDAVRFLNLGCTRLGTSASAAILETQETDSSSY